MAYYRHEGDDLDYTPVASVAAGTVVETGAYIGVVNNDIAANTKGSLRIRGVFEIPADATLTGSAVALGANVGIDVANQIAVAGAGDRAMPAAQAKPAGQTSVRFQLNNGV